MKLMFDINKSNFLKLLIFITLIFFNKISVLSQIVTFEEIYINCDSSEFAYIYENYSQDIYIYGTLTYNSKTYDSVRIRIRGDDSRKFPRKSLKIKFDKEPFANGRTTLNLNADWLDKSLIHTYLSTRVFNDLGYPCLKAGYAKVFLNGIFHGFFITIENVDEEFLQARGMTLNCNLYKASRDGSCLSLYDDLNFHWEKKIGDMRDFNDLKDLITMLNYSPDETFKDSLLKYFDYDKLLDVLSINFFIQNRSTYYHNYFMYHNLENDKWIMLPWDLDKTSGHYSIWLRYTDWGYAHLHANPLIERALANDQVFEDLKQRFKDIAERYYNDSVIHPIIDSLEKTLEPIIFEDSTRGLGTVEDWKKMLEYDRFHVHNCYRITTDQFREYPRNFHIDTKLFPEISNKIKFTWQKARSPLNRDVSYTLYISPNWDHSKPGGFSIPNISDTTYTLDSLLPVGTYFYFVNAVDGNWIQQSYDHLNLMQVKRATKLPCEINERFLLSKKESPYYIDCPLTISEKGELLAETGVEILILDTFKITSYGKISFIGNDVEPITIRVSQEVSKNAVLELLNNSVTDFIHCKFENIKIYAKNAQVMISNAIFDCSNKMILSDNVLDAWYSQVFIDSSKFLGNGKNEGLIFWYSNVNVNNSYFDNLADPIELTFSNNGKIINNIINNSKDDAIDLNSSSNCFIYKNFINNSVDKGISIGNKSLATSIKRNVIVSCSDAIAVKDSSFAIIENNTFYNNQIAINCYEKTTGVGGGTTNVSNCIFSNSNEKTISFDSISHIIITYSLSDNELINGEGNIKADPKFIDSKKQNFKLRKDSPCINKGDPNSELDPDGTISDIGAFFYNFIIPKIVINEINYNSSADFDSGDWVEFYNNQGEDVDISNWYFQDENDSHKFIFKEGTILKANSYLVLVEDEVKFKKVFPNTNNYIAGMGFGFSGSGELLRLFDNFERLVDSVRYDDNEPWPKEADGQGHSIELINPNYDNTKGENWQSSVNNGTPGEINTRYLIYKNPVSNGENIKLKIYPTPFANEFFFIFDKTYSLPCEIKIYDVLGNLLINKVIDNNYYNLVNIDMQNFNSGIYFYSITIGNKNYKGKILKTN